MQETLLHRTYTLVQRLSGTLSGMSVVTSLLVDRTELL